MDLEDVLIVVSGIAFVIVTAFIGSVFSGIIIYLIWPTVAGVFTFLPDSVTLKEAIFITWFASILLKTTVNNTKKDLGGNL